MIPARFAANLDWLYPELAYLDRVDAARADGFQAVEMLQPHLQDEAALAERLAGLRVALINAPAGDWAAGERGLMALPGREAEFRAAALRGMALAARLGAPRLHLMSGLADDGPETRAAWLANLAWAANQAPAGLVLTVEPINRRDMPGYFLHRQAQALALLATLASPRVLLQLDLYHCRVTEGGESLSHLARTLDLGLLGHVQVAGVDGRHEPGAQEYSAELALLGARGWPGAVGLEYRPRGSTSTGLSWLSPASG
ncbi:hydroxypyruvate isomerase family protein [Roseateles saccharophilus]|uniref:Hydroxypyruvate isomerase n=1 Tax=Roseateles saccharophilus TaxID=304 RepID=A0A4R3V1Z6_ROSSA|nr:TIM barrel protein [Roseateles saccharophilus]TCU98795.1 hydroxypyruvate isomerase [Roseateles saccharophilus]